MNDAIHSFERAGLGKAPFRCVGFHTEKYQACPGAPIQPGASCDYCGQGIMGVYVIASADGKRFKVGCDCVAKTGDRGLVSEVARNEAARRREMADERCASLVAQAREALEREEVRAALRAQPDPNGRPAPRTLLDYLSWCLENAGRTGKTKAARRVLAATHP